MITIKQTRFKVEREPLLAPFGFKGGYVHELWQSVVSVKDGEGDIGTGLGVQSVLWSDPQVYQRWGHERGNVIMNDITRHALKEALDTPFETPLDLLDKLVAEANEFASRIGDGEPISRTFALNALVPVDHAAWVLLSRKTPHARFMDLIPETYRSGLTYRHERLASVPVVSYSMTDCDIKDLLDEGYYVLKIKLGSDPHGDGDPEKMLEWDIGRLKQIHRIAGNRRCPHTANGKIAFYLDINGRYGSKVLLRKLVEAAGRMGALEQVLVVEEPFPEYVLEDVSDIPVRIACDESVHDENDAWARIRMGYGAIALKPAAKTMSMSLRIAKIASDCGIPCFCADLTANPVMVDWNKNLAARLAPLPGLSTGLIETNGKQNYRNWEGMKKRHPMHDGSWTETVSGQFRLLPEFYEYSGGVFGRGGDAESLFNE